jgi:hypothetical protein
MSFKRFVVVPIVLALVSGCGETSLEPATPDVAVADARGAPGPSASGSGVFIDDSNPNVDPALRNFGFTAFSDGSGQTQLVNRHVGLRLHGSVLCVNVVDGNKAWIAFRVTQTSDPVNFEVGHERGFRVVDNGRGKSGDDLDQIARSRRVGNPQNWCNNTPTPGDSPLNDIAVGGNITVRP